MRFSLRTLLLFFPALIASYALAWVFAVWLCDAPRMVKTIGYDQAVLNGYRSITPQVNLVIPLDWRKLNLYCAGKLPASDPDILLYWQHYAGTKDLQGQPYCCVPLNEKYSPDPDLVEPPHWGFYSVGQDGLSASYGEDPDDLNSWNFEKPSFWQAWNEQRSWYYRRAALCLCPFTFYFVYRLWKRFTRRRKVLRKLPEQIDYPVSAGPDRSLIPEFLKD